MDLSSSETRRPVLGSSQIVLAVLLLGAVWFALPARWWPVDGLGTAVALAWLASGAGLWGGQRWARPLARGVAVVTLVLGAALVTALAWTASHLAGLYGPVGGGGALILLVVALLVLPYLVVLPAVHVYLLRRPEVATSASATVPVPEQASPSPRTEAA